MNYERPGKHFSAYYERPGKHFSAYYERFRKTNTPSWGKQLGVFDIELNEVELGRIELPSASVIDFPIVHRFSPSNPRGGNHPLSRMTGCSGEFFAS